MAAGICLAGFIIPAFIQPRLLLISILFADLFAFRLKVKFVYLRFNEIH